MTALLELRGVRAYYGQVAALHGVDLEVHPGEMVVVLGANGAGKTTVLRAISRAIRTEGELVFRGDSMARLRTERVAQLGIGHVPEGRGTFVELTVAENLRLGALARGKRMRDRVRADTQAVYELFPALGEMRDRGAGALSGGQQQMLAIGRALLGRPVLLLLDELSLGLAPRTTAEIFARLRDLQTEWELSILLAEQNARLSLGVADRGYVLESGEIRASGSTDELQETGAVERAYLGG